MKMDIKIGISFLVVIFLICLVYFNPLHNLTNFQRGNLSNYSIVKYDIISDNFTGSTYIHWTHMPITYKINNPENCSSIIIKKLKEAFDIIENRTDNLITFKEVKDNSDIDLICVNRDRTIYCKNASFDYEKRSLNAYNESVIDKYTQEYAGAHLIKMTKNETIYEVCYYQSSMGVDTLGETVPDISGNIIRNAKIYILEQEDNWSSCIFPSGEVHSILNSLGLRNSVEEAEAPKFFIDSYQYKLSAEDIMYYARDCRIQTDINSKYSACLKSIYSNSTLIYSSDNCLNVKLFDTSIPCGKGYCNKGSSCCNDKCYSCSAGYSLDSSCLCVKN